MEDTRKTDLNQQTEAFEMSDNAQAFLESLRSIGDKFDAGLERVHKRIDEVGTDISKIQANNAVYTERLTNHIDRTDIHTKKGECCDTGKETSAKVDKHIDDHSTIVRKDINAIIGKAVVGAILLGIGAVAAAALFG